MVIVCLDLRNSLPNHTTAYFQRAGGSCHQKWKNSHEWSIVTELCAMNTTALNSDRKHAVWCAQVCEREMGHIFCPEPDLGVERIDIVALLPYELATQRRGTLARGEGGSPGTTVTHKPPYPHCPHPETAGSP